VSTLHKQLALSDILPGMVLSHNLLDTQGQILLPKGAVLTEKTIDSMARHNIASVRVVTGELTAEEDALRTRQAQNRLRYLFRGTEENPVNYLLHQYVSNFRAGERE
jgi:hypothetical protein